MAPKTPMFGIVFFVSKFLLGIEGEKKLGIYNFDPKSWGHAM